MNPFKNLFKDTFIYGIATVLPRFLSFLLIPLYTEIFTEGEYGIIAFIMSYAIFFNVILAYGMETTVFRYFNKNEDNSNVIPTAAISILFSSCIFLAVAIGFKHDISALLNIKLVYYQMTVWILFLDAICVIPLAYLRILKKSIYYAIVKIVNVSLNLGLNLFFLVGLPFWKNNFSALENICIDDSITYIFISYVICSGLSVLMLSPFYLKLKYRFDINLWKNMLKYSWPILVAGFAFSINETLDKILLTYLLPENISEAQVGIYTACYKLSLFMTLFATAFRLGVEPFFFSHAKTKNPKKAYALITKYFVIIGLLILLSVTVFLDYLKLIIRREGFYEALGIVPIILLANLCLGIYHNLSVWYKVTDRTYFGAIISSVGATLTLFVNFAFIPTYGYVASALATLLAYFSMMVLSYLFGQKYYKIDYPLKRLSLYAVIGIFCSGLYFYGLRHYFWVGILMILVYIFIVYIQEKKELLGYLKKSSK